MRNSTEYYKQKPLGFLLNEKNILNVSPRNYPRYEKTLVYEFRNDMEIFFVDMEDD